jgi:hypothetical protein
MVESRHPSTSWNPSWVSLRVTSVTISLVEMDMDINAVELVSVIFILAHQPTQELIFTNIVSKASGHLQPSSHAAERQGIRPMKE